MTRNASRLQISNLRSHKEQAARRRILGIYRGGSCWQCGSKLGFQRGRASRLVKRGVEHRAREVVLLIDR